MFVLKAIDLSEKKEKKPSFFEYMEEVRINDGYEDIPCAGKLKSAEEFSSKADAEKYMELFNISQKDFEIMTLKEAEKEYYGS